MKTLLSGILICISCYAYAQSTMITWKGKSVEAASGEALVLIKPGISKTTLIASLQGKGFSLKKDMSAMGVFLFGVSGDLLSGINTIRSDEYVKYAGPNTTMKIDAVPNDQYYQSQQSGNSISINAEAAWNITKGSPNIIVSDFDTGIPLSQGTLTHEDLMNAARIIVGPDFTNEPYPNNNIRDNLGHGTHVLGILSAESNNIKGIAGASWNTKIYATQVLTSQGSSFVSFFCDAVQNAVLNGVRIINFSAHFSPESGSDTCLVTTIEYLRNNNVLLVAASGNENSGINYPAAYSAYYDNVIAVGALNGSSRWVSGYTGSNYGSALNIMAPGYNVYSTLPAYSTQYSPSGEKYGSETGTSMATPFVAGVAALILSRNPFLTSGQVGQSCRIRR